LLSEMRERLRKREPGWTWEILREVEEAAALPEARENQAELRSIAASCLGGVDLRPGPTLAEGFPAYRVAFSPDGKLLALVQGVGGGGEAMRVRRFDTGSWR